LVFAVLAWLIIRIFNYNRLWHVVLFGLAFRVMHGVYTVSIPQNTGVTPTVLVSVDNLSYGAITFLKLILSNISLGVDRQTHSCH
jgi:hypothetical protein